MFARFPALRDFPWVNLPLVLLGLVLSAVGLWRAFARPGIWRGKVVGSIGFAFSLFVAGLFCFYVFAFSSWLPEPTVASLTLSAAPDFALADSTGREVRLADYRGRKVYVVFYRGYW